MPRTHTLALLALVATATSAAAQRPGGGPPPGMMRGGGGRLDPAMFDPVVRDGPPSRDQLDILVTLTPDEGTAYAAQRDSLLTRTAAVRDSVIKAGPGLPMGGGPGVPPDPEMRERFETMRKQRRELADAQESLDKWLKERLGKERYGKYDRWRKDQREAAMAGLREEMMRRMREGGGPP